MNYGGDAADQIVRYSLEGTEVALKLTGEAAKNFAVFAAAVLKDQKKMHGRTNLTRLLRDGKPLKFFVVPEERMKEFAVEANARGLLFVPVKDKTKEDGKIEIAVWAEDAAKVNRVLEKMKLDYVQADTGSKADVVTAISEKVKQQTALTPQTEVVETPAGVPFPVSWTVKMKKKQKETQDILSYHSQAAGCSDKARAKASGGRQPIEECGRTGL